MEVPADMLPLNASCNMVDGKAEEEEDLFMRRISSTSAVYLKTTWDGRFRPWIILGVMIFDEAIHPDRMWQLLVERLHRFDRFQCRVQVNSDGSFIFQQVREIDRSYHLVEVNATGWTADHLNQYLSHVYSEDKDLTRPLWRVHVLNGMAGGRHGVLVNVDHALGDGASMVEVLLTLMDPSGPDAHPSNSPSWARKEKSAAKVVENNVTPARRSLNGPGKKAATSSVWRKVVGAAGQACWIWGVLVWGAIEPIVLPFLPPDAPSILKPLDVHPSKKKIIARAETMSLDRVKAIKNQFPGATVNDVLSATLALALRKYYREVSPLSEMIVELMPLVQPPSFSHFFFAISCKCTA
mmetsp:Transcript_29692/g.78243  ORF Transcript_29692/g.78243 Transcript_29692/m.78243 type:complete len:353 (+) Transcript_29692:217-1275(+)